MSPPARPHGPIQKVAGKGLWGAENHFGLGDRARERERGEEREARQHINSVVSGTRGRRMLMTPGKLNSACQGVPCGDSHRKSGPGPVIHCRENAIEQAVPGHRDARE